MTRETISKYIFKSELKIFRTDREKDDLNSKLLFSTKNRMDLSSAEGTGEVRGFI